MTQASAPTTDKRILIAKIAQSHGVRGLVKLHLYTETPEILDTATLYKNEHGKDTLTPGRRRIQASSMMIAAGSPPDRT